MVLGGGAGVQQGRNAKTAALFRLIFSADALFRYSAGRFLCVLCEGMVRQCGLSAQQIGPPTLRAAGWKHLQDRNDREYGEANAW